MSRRFGMIVMLFLAVALAAWPNVAGDPKPAATAEDPSAAGPKLDVKRIELDNGLRIFVLERTASPTFAAVYQFDVGGVNDPKGRSGIAHLLEHMMFKGSRNVSVLDADREAGLMARLSELWRELEQELDKRDDPFREEDADKIAKLEKEIEEVSADHKKLIVKNEYDELMTRAGGVSLNASTNRDATTYLVQLPSNRLEFWFKMEAERLLNPVFREFYSERDVVAEERRLRTENTPGGTMYESLQSLLYSAHPYGTPVIGWPRDIQRLKREDALSYFRTYYSPSNCVLALAGDVKAAEVEKLAKKYLSGWQRQEIPRPVITAEPEHKGERRQVVEFDAEPRLSMAWLTVPEGHPDQYALDVLARLLGGLYSSRLDKIVVQQDRIATSVGTGHPTMRYGGYFSASGNPRGEHTVEELEAAIEREIKKIQDDGVSAKELERAKVGVEVSRVRSLKSNLGQAFRIVNAVRQTGSIDYLEEYERRMSAVTADDVRRTAAKYLTPSRKNVVMLQKVPGVGGGALGGTGTGVSHQRGGAPGGRGLKHSGGYGELMEVIRGAPPISLTVPEIGKDVDRVELPGGITVFIKEDHSAPSIGMSLAWLGGYNTMPVEDLAVFELASELLEEGGTKDLDPTALQERLDELGMSFAYSIGSVESDGYFWSLKRNFGESYELAMDMLMHPRLDEKRFETLKGQYIESMKRRYDSPGLGARLVESHVFDRDHPRLGYVASKKEIEALTAADVRGVWRRYLGRNNLFITAVGDFDKREMLDRISATFGKWRAAESVERKHITRDPVIRPGVYIVEKDIPQPVVRLRHHIAVDRTAPLADHAALEIFNDILGGSGFRSRLMERLRSDEGLTYGIRSFLSHQGRPGQPGSVGVSYATKKDSVAHSIDSVLEEFGKIVRDKPTEAEVEEQIEAWRNRFVFGYTDDLYSVSQLMSSELDDRPYDYARRMLDAVQKVTVEDVLRVAKQYLKPETLTISVFGTLSSEDVATLGERFEVKVLSKEDVFTGGYEEPNEADAVAAPAVAR